MRRSISNAEGQGSRVRAWALAAFVLAIGALIAIACGGNGGDTGAPTAEEEKLKVVTSLGLFADFVREVGGDRVEVTALLPPGADPHTFEPTPKDVQKLTEAEVVFINGLGLEGGLEDTVRTNVSGQERVVYLSGIQADDIIGVDDVHWWLDATKAVEYVSRVRDALVQADSRDEDYFRGQAGDYIQQLRDLDVAVQREVDQIPPPHRKLITFHKSFNTFAARYGFEVVGFVVVSPGGDPSPRDVADLLEAVRQEEVPAVFTEPQFNADVLEGLADDAGVEVCTLYSDALDERVRTYIEMMRFNASELVRCLSGESGG